MGDRTIDILRVVCLFLFFSSASGIMKVIGWIIVLVAATVSIYRLIRGKYPVGSGDVEITRRLQELIGEE